MIVYRDWLEIFQSYLIKRCKSNLPDFKILTKKLPGPYLVL